MARELRAIAMAARAAGEGDSATVAGLGIIYDQWTELWRGYKERINRGAVVKAAEVKSFFNHDPSQVLSTDRSDPPLELRDTEEGLEFISPIPPTSYGRDLEINLKRGNVKGASFAFDIPEGGDRFSEDEDGIVHREIKSLILYEIGPVTDPAFVQTTAILRSAKQSVEEWRQSRPPVARNLRERKQRLARIYE